MQLAEINVAVPLYELDDPRIADFTNNIDRINGLAQTMDGFVWMHKDDPDNSPAPENPWPGAVVNMSVWQTAEQLEHFVWNTVHKQIYNRKNEWFSTMKSHHFAMWWVEDGHQPTLNEAKERLDYLDAQGNTDHAFDWAHLPHVKLWQKQRCG